MSDNGQKALKIEEGDSTIQLDAMELIQTIPWKNISKQKDVDFLVAYTRNAFWPINTILRNHLWKAERNPAVTIRNIHSFVIETLSQVVGAYSQLKNHQDMPKEGEELYRYFSTTDETLTKYKIGDTITERAFCSTSLLKKTMFLANGEGAEYCYEITVGKRTNGRNLGKSISYFWEKEQEVLFPPGTKFKINGIVKEKNLTTFHLTEELDDPADPEFCLLTQPPEISPLLVPTAEVLAAPSQNTKTIKVHGRGQEGEIELPIPVLNVISPSLTLTPASLGDVCEIINQYTASQPYPVIPNDHTVSIGGQKITLHRPNHDGTHGARQVRNFEACMDLALQCASLPKRTILQTLSEDDLLQLKLVVYCLRTGRVDELSSHVIDDYNTRSAEIYQAYAEQLGIPKPTIARFKTHLVEACRPIYACSEQTRKNPLALLCHEMISAAHLMDLMRCTYESEYAKKGKRFEELTDCVAHFLGQDRSLVQEQWTPQLVGFARKVCLATAIEPHSVSRPVSGKENQRVELHQRGKKCLQAVQAVPFPKWIDILIQAESANSD